MRMKTKPQVYQQPAPPQITLPRVEAPVANLLQKMEALEKDLESNAHTGHTRWMVPYADLLTLLLGLFLVLFTVKADPRLSLQKPAAPAVAPTSANALKNSTQTPIHSATQGQQASAMTKDAALANQLQQQLHKEFNMKGVIIRQQERGLVISLKDSILFAPGSADLSPAARKTLDRVTGQLTAALHGQSRLIRVEGHTDNTPITTSRYPSNWELSTARATNIVRYLIAGHRFSPANLSAAGYGEFRPVENNSSIEGKQKNRRVDIVILNDSTAHQEPPQLPNVATRTKGAPGGAIATSED